MWRAVMDFGQTDFAKINVLVFPIFVSNPEDLNLEP